MPSIITRKPGLRPMSRLPPYLACRRMVDRLRGATLRREDQHVRTLLSSAATALFGPRPARADPGGLRRDLLGAGLKRFAKLHCRFPPLFLSFFTGDPLRLTFSKTSFR